MTALSQGQPYKRLTESDIYESKKYDRATIKEENKYMTQQRPQVVTIDPNYSINRLVVAMFQEAVKQARRCDRSARQWLYAEGVLWIDVILDVHPDHTRRWLDRQLKRRKKKKPNLDTVSIHAENMRASLPIFQGKYNGMLRYA